MLHGCMQKPEDLATASGMNDLADANNFLVVYPEQVAAANPLSCWNWFDPKHQTRDAGEPALIAAVIQTYALHITSMPNAFTWSEYQRAARWPW